VRIVNTYPLAPGHMALSLRKGAQLLRVTAPAGHFGCVLTVLEDEAAPRVVREFDVIGSHMIVPDGAVYVGSFEFESCYNYGLATRHVFDLGERA